MSNNNWYDSSDWYEPLNGSEAGKPGKKRKKGWTTSRVIGLVVILLVLLVGTSMLFAVPKHNFVSFSWNNNGDKGSWSSGGGFPDGELPEDRDEFFENFYQQVENSVSEINIPEAKLPFDYRMELEEQGSEKLSLQELYSSCTESIVAISGYTDGQEGFYWGTGVILSSDGLILTNTHVIDGCDKAVVTLHNDEEYEGRLVGADPISDIAVLKIDARNLTAAHFGESSGLAVGDEVAAIGNPLGETFRFTLTDGIISAIERGINYKGHSMTLLQTNTALNEGNSGGALFNMYGQVIGITNMKMMSSYSSIEGIGFAIPTATVQSVVNSLVRYGEVRGRPSIGITVGAIPEEAREQYDLPEGLYVSGVQENSDAAEKGIKSGDVITHVNFEAVTTTDEINDIKNSLEVGDVMIFTIWRDGETMDIEVILRDTNDVY
ncbi:MAG: S1C family serine protease [Candidatus Limivicinus sp.]|jgi:serine protease Do